MPAGLPEATLVQNQANPTQGRPVIFDLLSGPKGSPFDARKPPATANNPFVNDTGNISTGALSTGIGFGLNYILTSPIRGNYMDDYTPGVTKPDGTAATNSTLMYIGGGKSSAAGATVPYTAGFGIGAAGNGGSRDGGAGPAFTGFTVKTVTAAAGVANGAVVETGFTNRSGVALVTGQSVFGSNGTASAVVA